MSNSRVFRGYIGADKIINDVKELVNYAETITKRCKNFENAFKDAHFGCEILQYLGIDLKTYRSLEISTDEVDKRIIICAKLLEQKIKESADNAK